MCYNVMDDKCPPQEEVARSAGGGTLFAFSLQLAPCPLSLRSLSQSKRFFHHFILALYSISCKMQVKMKDQVEAKG